MFSVFFSTVAPCYDGYAHAPLENSGDLSTGSCINIFVRGVYQRERERGRKSERDAFPSADDDGTDSKTFTTPY